MALIIVSLALVFFVFYFDNQLTKFSNKLKAFEHLNGKTETNLTEQILHMSQLPLSVKNELKKDIKQVADELMYLKYEMNEKPKQLKVASKGKKK